MSKFNHLFKTAITDSDAYHCPNRTDMIKLDAMEMPDDIFSQVCPPNLLSESVALNRYPVGHNALKTRICNTLQLPSTTGVLLGNGSDEIIQMLLLSLRHNSKMLSFTPSFVMYTVLAKQMGIQTIELPLTAHFQIDLPATLDCIKKQQPSILFIASPNNPTGNAMSPDSIHAILKQSTDTLVVIDEAYQAFFTPQNYLSSLDAYPNLLISRTFSKTGFAGLRFGFLIGRSSILDQIEKVRLPYNLSNFTQYAADVILKKHELITRMVNQVHEQKNWLEKALTCIQHLTIFPSDANFFLIQIKPPFQALKLYEFLKINGILIKLMPPLPACDNMVRITVGSNVENKLLVQQIRRFFR